MENPATAPKDPAELTPARKAEPVGPTPGRYRSAMLRRFGLLYWLSSLGVLLQNIRLEEHSAENIRRADARGPLVYALYSRSLIDWLALNRMLNRRRLPLASFANGVRSTWLRPLGEAAREAWGALRDRLRHGPAPDPVASGWLAGAVARGLTTCLFLVRPRQVTEVLGGRRPDPVEALIEAQRHSRRPVQVVPVVVVWRRPPEAARGEVARFLLGNQDEPGPLQKLWSVLTRSGVGIVQAGQPLDLGELLERYEDAPRDKQVRVARIALRRYLYRESHVIRGPRIRPHRTVRRIVLTSPEVTELVQQEASVTGRSPYDIRAEVDKVLDHMAARMSPAWMQGADLFCRFLFNRIYDGVDIRPEDAERLRAAMRAGTPVIVPNHRSHLDYILISWVFYRQDLAPPHVVAGDNLSFWPLGPALRRMGGFFIKRSFKGDRVFPVVFERYLRQLIRDGFPVEFYVEGGRSRTGKMLPARHGVLGMVLDAAAGGREDREVTFLPISISYEQIAEEKAYYRELSGQPKEKEDIGQLVRATRVMKSRYGKVYLRVGEPLKASDVFQEAGGDWRALDREHRTEALERTGERIVYRIAQANVILPTALVAMALLAQSRRGVRVTELHARVRRFHELLVRRGATPASSLSHGGWVVEQALQRFERNKMVTRLEDEEGDILQVSFEKRITLEYYKNSLIHFVVPISLMAAAVRGLVEAGEAVTPRTLFRLFRMQVFLLRYEFTLDPEVPLHAVQAGALDELVAYGALKRRDDGTIEVVERRFVGELAELTRNYLESYLLVLQGAHALRSRDIPLSELPTRIQEWGKVRLAVDELQRHEALSLANLKNAVKAFREEGVLELRTGGAGLQFDETACDQYVADLKKLLIWRTT